MDDRDPHEGRLSTSSSKGQVQGGWLFSAQDNEHRTLKSRALPRRSGSSSVAAASSGSLAAMSTNRLVSRPSLAAGRSVMSNAKAGAPAVKRQLIEDTGHREGAGAGAAQEGMYRHHHRSTSPLPSPVRPAVPSKIPFTSLRSPPPLYKSAAVTLAPKRASESRLPGESDRPAKRVFVGCNKPVHEAAKEDDDNKNNARAPQRQRTKLKPRRSNVFPSCAPTGTLAATTSSAAGPCAKRAVHGLSSSLQPPLQATQSTSLMSFSPSKFGLTVPREFTFSTSPASISSRHNLGHVSQLPCPRSAIYSPALAPSRMTPDKHVPNPVLRPLLQEVRIVSPLKRPDLMRRTLERKGSHDNKVEMSVVPRSIEAQVGVTQQSKELGLRSFRTEMEPDVLQPPPRQASAAPPGSPSKRPRSPAGMRELSVSAMTRAVKPRREKMTGNSSGHLLAQRVSAPMPRLADSNMSPPLPVSAEASAATSHEFELDGSGHSASSSSTDDSNGTLEMDTSIMSVSGQASLATLNSLLSRMSIPRSRSRRRSLGLQLLDERAEMEEEILAESGGAASSVFGSSSRSGGPGFAAGTASSTARYALSYTGTSKVATAPVRAPARSCADSISSGSNSALPSRRVSLVDVGTRRGSLLPLASASNAAQAALRSPPATLAATATDTATSGNGSGSALKEVVAFVDVKTAEGDEAGGVFWEMLRSLGARVGVCPGPKSKFTFFLLSSPGPG